MRGTMEVAMAAVWNQRDTTSAGSDLGMQVIAKKATAAVIAARMPITKPAQQEIASDTMPIPPCDSNYATSGTTGM